VKLIDANLLLYAVNEDAPLHGPAREWLNTTLSGTETIALTWSVLLAFLRLSTRPIIFPTPLSPDQAFDTIDAWLSQPCVTVVHPTERHPSVLRDLILRAGTAGNLTTDAHLAAIAIEHGAELCSCDRDFARFSGLRWNNPLSGG
jgi:toxin-antitoxin system PIN domain toxin